MLLDSDCVPVTLFEVADLWKELSLLRDGLTPITTSSSKGQAVSASDESVPKASKLSHDQWKHQTVGQGVLLVTERNAEVNAGFIAGFASSQNSVIPEQRRENKSPSPGRVYMFKPCSRTNGNENEITQFTCGPMKCKTTGPPRSNCWPMCKRSFLRSRGQ